MAQLTPFDILIIQTAIEDYKRKYRKRPVPSAEEALAWRAGHKMPVQSQTTPEPGRLHSIAGNFRKWFVRDKPVTIFQ
jgi:hypothetical protein